MYKVLVGEYIDDEAVAGLQKARDVKVDVKVGISREEILEIIHEYDALIVRSVIKVDKELLDKAKNLKIVGRAGNGTDNINIPEATAHGVIVANTPDSNTVSACEIAIGLMIASARNIVAANNFIKSGKWEREIFVGNELFEKTLGIIGLGRIGGLVATRMKAFGMKLVAYDPYISDERFKRYSCEKAKTLDELMEKSDIQDKNLIISVLSMYSDPEQREKEIKNLSAAYTEIKEKVLPQLRRSQIVFTKETVGKSDEQIAKLLNEDPSKLSIEEMLYAANLNSDLNYKRDVFMKIVSQYPEDIRGYNNLGVVEYKLGNMAEANRNFTKALEINKNDAVANFNKASILIAQGNISEAKTYLGYAAGVGEDLNYANAAIAITEGNYSKAVSLYGKSNTNNAALARILNKDYSGAKNILENIQTPDAKTYYLKSIVAARTNNVNDLVKSVTMAINADNSYKEKFLNDMEFRSFLTNDAFASLLR